MIPGNRNGPPSDDEATNPGRTPAPRPSMSGPGVSMPESWDARRSARVAPVVSKPPPSARGGNRSIMVLAVLAVISTTTAAGVITWRFTSPPARPGSPSAPSPVTAVAPSVAGATSQQRRATTSVAVARETAPTPSEPPPVPRDKAACFAGLLPEGAFGATHPNLDSSCSGRRAYQTMLLFKSEIVRAGGTELTPAMVEWSKLGWFEMATFAAMRAHCCPDERALSVPAMFARCRLEESLAYITNALDDDAAMRGALDDYTKAARCVASHGWSDAFGQGGAPYGGELVYVERIIGRISEARGR